MSRLSIVSASKTGCQRQVALDEKKNRKKESNGYSELITTVQVEAKRT